MLSCSDLGVQRVGWGRLQLLPPWRCQHCPMRLPMLKLWPPQQVVIPHPPCNAVAAAPSERMINLWLPTMFGRL